MTRIEYNNKSDTFCVQEKIFIFGWVDKTALDDYGNELPCTLAGFDTLEEAIDNSQTDDYYITKKAFKEGLKQ